MDQQVNWRSKLNSIEVGVKVALIITRKQVIYPCAGLRAVSVFVAKNWNDVWVGVKG